MTKLIAPLLAALLCLGSGDGYEDGGVFGTYTLDVTQKSYAYVNGGGKVGGWTHDFTYTLHFRSNGRWCITISAPGDDHHVLEGYWTPNKPGKGYYLTLDGNEGLLANAMYALDELVPLPKGTDWNMLGVAHFEGTFTPTANKAKLKIVTTERGMLGVAGIRFSRKIKGGLAQ
jgi:hypothetical protein